MAELRPINDGVPINPFVIDGAKNPEQKEYLLLLRLQYTGEEDSFEWLTILGRTHARKYVIDHIEEIDPHRSYVLAEGTPFESAKMPSVYELFTDPRSSWSNPDLFPDKFDIEAYVDSIPDDKESEFEQGSEASSSADYNQAILESTDGVDL